MPSYRQTDVVARVQVALTVPVVQEGRAGRGGVTLFLALAHALHPLERAAARHRRQASAMKLAVLETGIVHAHALAPRVRVREFGFGVG